MDKIEKIRQYIESLYDGEVPKHDQQCDFSDGYFTGLSVISNFLDTLSEEPSKSLQEEIETWIPTHINVKTDETLPINPTELADVCKEWGKCIALHFAKWGAEHLRDSTKMIDKSLEEAAEDAVCMAFGGDPAYYGNKAEFSVNECIRLFIAGAEWQKNQIFKDAINGWLDEDNEPPYDLNVICEEKIPFGKFKHGDKVHILVLKAEEE